VVSLPPRSDHPRGLQGKNGKNEKKNCFKKTPLGVSLDTYVIVISDLFFFWWHAYDLKTLSSLKN
jgi:hypothetical protein